MKGCEILKKHEVHSRNKNTAENDVLEERERRDQKLRKKKLKICHEQTVAGGEN